MLDLKILGSVALLYEHLNPLFQSFTQAFSKHYSKQKFRKLGTENSAKAII